MLVRECANSNMSKTLRYPMKIISPLSSSSVGRGPVVELVAVEDYSTMERRSMNSSDSKN